MVPPWFSIHVNVKRPALGIFASLSEELSGRAAFQVCFPSLHFLLSLQRRAQNKAGSAATRNIPLLLPAALVRACEECSGEDKQVIIRPARCREAAGHTSEAHLFIAKCRRVHLPLLKQFTAAVIHEPSRATCFAARIFLGERKGNSCF